MDLNSLQDKARRGDQTAENQLFDYLRARFSLLARRKLVDREDAEEIVQEALGTIFEKYRQVDFEVSFAAWAYKVLENKILGLYRTQHRRRAHEEKLAHLRANPAQESPESDLEARLLDCLRRLNKVNRRHARVLVFKYQGYSVTEICDRLGLTRTNLYTLLSRARSLLEFCLEKGDLKK